jgi:hypothetical protein
VSGIVCYLLFAGILIYLQPHILANIQSQKQNTIDTYNLTPYQNNYYGYTISYPKAWTLYEWKNKSITLYNNESGIVINGIWISISVSSLLQSNYVALYESRPGLVSYNGGAKNLITKIANISFQKYTGVKYISIITGPQNSEYHIHYLIHKNDQIYDIDFMNLNQITQNANRDLFDRIIRSFQFTK